MSSAKKVYTKTGDQGKTSLVGGSRVAKDHIRIHTYGTLDELNSFIGVLHDEEASIEYRPILIDIQNHIFIAESLLAAEKNMWQHLPTMTDEHIEFLEREIDKMDKSLEPLRHFILPGGHSAVSWCHVARTVCRRAERYCYTLSQNHEVDQNILIYLNRLSDYFFVLARKMAQDLGLEQNIWKA